MPKHRVNTNQILLTENQKKIKKRQNLSAAGKLLKGNLKWNIRDLPVEEKTEHRLPHDKRRKFIGNPVYVILIHY